MVGVSDECWLCDSKDVVYTDSIGAGWCEEHYREYYEEGEG